MKQFNSITREQYNNKKIAFGDNSKMRFSVVRKVLYTLLHHKKGLTLIELLIALSIFTIIVLGFSSIDTFSRYHVITSDKKAKLQNEASYLLEHMAKEIGKAIGSRVISGQDPIDLTNISGDTAIRAYVDLASDGVSPGDGQRATGGDRWRAYRCYSSGGSRELRYYSNYVNPSSPYEVLSQKISAFSPSVTANYVSVDITACWDADGSPAACGSLDNPSLSMKNRISMPAVSTN